MTNPAPDLLAATAAARPLRSSETGTVLVVLMILFLGFGAIAYGGLTMSIAENQKSVRRFSALQSQAIADGQMELAKNLVNASRYDVYMRNRVLRDALSEPNQVIPGTDVRIEQVGASNYFTLRTSATHGGVTSFAEAVVRESSPVSQYNLFVIDHPVGLSGQPRGAIHTNKWVDFYFPGGHYRDSVTAVEGFNFVAGASAENTRFSGTTNPAAPPSNVLESVDFADLWSNADVLAITDTDLVAEVVFEGSTARVDLYRPRHVVMRTRTRQRQVFSHYETVDYVESEPIYTDVPYTVTETVYRTEEYREDEQRPVYWWRLVTQTVTENVYEDRVVEYEVQVPVYATRDVERQVQRYVWISYDSSSSGTSSSGGTVASSGDGSGYWAMRTVTETVEETYIDHYATETRSRTERVKVGTRSYDRDVWERYVHHYDTVSVRRTRQVPDGTREVTLTRQEITGYRDVPKTREVAVYDTVTETYEEPVEIAEQFVRSETMALNGTAFIGGDVRKISGAVSGRLSLIVGGSVEITDNIRYVDADGDTRMLNGTDPEQPYTENPQYDGNALLAIMANDDVLYSKDGPSNLEVNASLVSANGSVSFEGIVTSSDGTDVWTELPTSGNHVRNSLRRLGGIVSRKRPVATYIDDRGYITAGYERGESVMDQNLILSAGNNAPPPFMFEAAVPTWVITTSGRRLGNID